MRRRHSDRALQAVREQAIEQAQRIEITISSRPPPLSPESDRGVK